MTLALNPRMQNAEEERRVILEMNSTDMENNRINADYLVAPPPIPHQ